VSKPKKKPGARQQPPARPPAWRKFLIIMSVGLVIGIAAAVTILRGANGSFDTLKGRWLRPDGGYVLEIRSIDSKGKIEAAYFNPKSINIAKADASQDGPTLKVFVELRAPNYPGSTYTLSYDQEHDQLRGIYFQAVQQQSFNVYFVRMK
jgi:hypothetical protein